MKAGFEMSPSERREYIETWLGNALYMSGLNNQTLHNPNAKVKQWAAAFRAGVRWDRRIAELREARDRFY